MDRYYFGLYFLCKYYTKYSNNLYLLKWSTHS